MAQSLRFSTVENETNLVIREQVNIKVLSTSRLSAPVTSTPLKKKAKKSPVKSYTSNVYILQRYWSHHFRRIPEKYNKTFDVI